MKRVLALLSLTGCAIGGGSAYVGQWRPHDEVEFEACLVDDAGRCTDRKEVVQHVPGRRFWGAIVSFPAMGFAKTSHAGLDKTVMRVAPTLELLRGTGRWAYGLRSGLVIDAVVGMNDKEGGATVLPLEAIGRMAVIDRLSLYGGVGFAPFAQSQGERAFSGEHVLAGLQYALSKTHSENFIILSLEADTMFIQFDDPYRSSGLTGSIGLFF